MTSLLPAPQLLHSFPQIVFLLPLEIPKFSLHPHPSSIFSTTLHSQLRTLPHASLRKQKPSEVAHLLIPRSTILPAPMPNFLLLPPRPSLVSKGGSPPIISFLFWIQSLSLHVIFSPFLMNYADRKQTRTGTFHLLKTFLLCIFFKLPFFLLIPLTENFLKYPVSTCRFHSFIHKPLLLFF